MNDIGIKAQLYIGGFTYMQTVTGITASIQIVSELNSSMVTHARCVEDHLRITLVSAKKNHLLIREVRIFRPEIAKYAQWFAHHLSSDENAGAL